MFRDKISIVIPAKNCEKTIIETLDSIKKQSYQNFEVIIVNDGSSDKTIETINKYNSDNALDCKIISLKKSYGASRARNIGASKAKGKILVFVDSDIVLFKNALEEGLKYRAKNKNLAGFFGLFTPELRFKNLLSQYKHLYLCHLYSKQGEKRSTFDTSLSFIDKKTFDKYKFDEKIRCISEDAEIAMRMIKDGHSIKQASNVQMEHIKKYTLKNFVRSEYTRGKLFSRLLLHSIFRDKKENGVKTFYLKPLNIYLNVAIMPFLILFLIVALFTSSLIPLYSAGLLFVTLVALNFEFWTYLRKRNGIMFALLSVFVSFFDMIVMDIGIAVTTVNFLIGRDVLIKQEESNKL